MFESSLKTAEIHLSQMNILSKIGTKVVRTRPFEKCRVKGMVNDMPGVHKVPMVRMSAKTDEPANVRV